MSRDICQQYNKSFFSNPGLLNILKTNRDGSRTLTTDYGNCHIFLMSFVNQPLSLVVDEDFFHALSLREFDSGNLVEITSDNVRSDSDKFDLIIKYEADISLKGDVSIRIEHPNRSEDN